MSRISCPVLSAKIATAEESMRYIHHGDNVGFSGFTGAGYPKAVPGALAGLGGEAEHAAGREFQIGLGPAPPPHPKPTASWPRPGHRRRGCPKSDPVCARINAGEIDYIDVHLSHVAQHTWFGFFGKIDVAIIEVTAAYRTDGSCPPPPSATTRPGWIRPSGSSSRSTPGSRASSRECTTSTTAPRCRRTAGRSS